MTISIKDLPKASEGSSIPKTISPGEHVVKINGFYLEDFPKEPGSKFLIMKVETPPIEGFTGFMIDKDDPSKGNHAGQIGKVKTKEWAYKDTTLAGGIEIKRDEEILKFIRAFCTTINRLDWFEDQDNKHESIEDFVYAFDKSDIYKDILLKMCIRGNEYVNRRGYIAYDLSLPKYVRGSVTYELADAKTSGLMKFDPALHIKKKDHTNRKEVDNFEGKDELLTNIPDDLIGL